MNPIPIFVICRDRLTVLEESLRSYMENIDTVRTPVTYILHDNGSTFPPMLKFLDEMDNDSNIEVVRGKRNDLNAVSNTISEYMKSCNSPYYIVTDPDIALDNVPGDILEYYAHILHTLKVKVVGPMLRIDDLPNHYPLKNKVRSSHSRQFWHKEPSTLEWKGNNYHYQHAHIDTTFGMYRKGFKFKNLNPGIRTYAPYAAKHLDWYLDPEDLKEDQIHYSKHASKAISHWGLF